MLKLLKKLLMFGVVLGVAFAAFITYHMQIHVVATTDEVIPPNETADIKVAASTAEGIVEALKTSYAARGVHSKGHACVKAYVNVNDDIDPAFQYGVLQTPGKQYKSWIRFSNSSSNMAKPDDNLKDARGMAIKLLNAGDNLSGGTTQEFIAHNTPAFFVSTVDDYNQFVATKGDPMYFIQGYNPFEWRIRELWQLVTAYAQPPASPLWTEYFSNTAYKLGPHNIKFKMKACSAQVVATAIQQDDPDFLKHNLAKELADQEACMQLMVQRQQVDKQMSIEDPTILWKESESPFDAVATIQIVKQTFDTPVQQAFCENLSFTPWNALAEHQPIGALNRARKWVYEASSKYRHAANHTTVPESLDW
jgi:catalase